MSDRQTFTYLSRTFEAAGIQPKTKYGQNFLIDLNILDVLSRGADFQRNDVILEIGTGMGSLTKRMSPVVGHVVTVEIDRELQVLAARELASCPNITMLTCDVLRNKNHLRQEVIGTVSEKLAANPGAKFKLVANLPYNVATPIISNLLTVTPLPERMVVTIQRELAERIVAPPAAKTIARLPFGCSRFVIAKSCETCRRACFGLVQKFSLQSFELFRTPKNELEFRMSNISTPPCELCFFIEENS